MILVVCGLSKCGKSSLIDAISLRGLVFTTIKGSGLLLERGMATTRLTPEQSVNNQSLILETLKKISDSNENIVFDGHLLIETIEGPQLVPDSVFNTLDIAGIASVYTDPVVLSQRRINTPFECDEVELADLERIETIHARRIARKHAVKHFHICSNDVDSFAGVANSCFGL